MARHERNIGDCWTAIEQWLAANAPDVLAFLPAGISKEGQPHLERVDAC